jgi:hypothetical protein
MTHRKKGSFHTGDPGIGLPDHGNGALGYRRRRLVAGRDFVDAEEVLGVVLAL